MVGNKDKKRAGLGGTAFKIDENILKLGIYSIQF